MLKLCSQSIPVRVRTMNQSTEPGSYPVIMTLGKEYMHVYDEEK